MRLCPSVAMCLPVLLENCSLWLSQSVLLVGHIRRLGGSHPALHWHARARSPRRRRFSLERAKSPWRTSVGHSQARIPANLRCRRCQFTLPSTDALTAEIKNGHSQQIEDDGFFFMLSGPPELTDTGGQWGQIGNSRGPPAFGPVTWSDLSRLLSSV